MRTRPLHRLFSRTGGDWWFQWELLLLFIWRMFCIMVIKNFSSNYITNYTVKVASCWVGRRFISVDIFEYFLCTKKKTSYMCKGNVEDILDTNTSTYAILLWVWWKVTLTVSEWISLLRPPGLHHRCHKWGRWWRLMSSTAARGGISTQPPRIIWRMDGIIHCYCICSNQSLPIIVLNCFKDWRRKLWWRLLWRLHLVIGIWR